MLLYIIYKVMYAGYLFGGDLNNKIGNVAKFIDRFALKISQGC